MILARNIEGMNEQYSLRYSHLVETSCQKDLFCGWKGGKGMTGQNTKIILLSEEPNGGKSLTEKPEGLDVRKRFKIFGCKE